MTTQREKAHSFRDLHLNGSPLILFNVWDAGSARTVEQAGAKAIATSSWSVAAAHGLADGEKLPFKLALANLGRIVKSVPLPVTIDLESGYATELSELRENIEQVIAAGAVGINFEDQIIEGGELYAIEDQCTRIEAIRETVKQTSIPLFINARTDVFLKTYPAKHDEVQLEEAVRRAAAYAEAGANGLFAPGLRDTALIKKLCDLSPVPVNIMVLPDTPPTAILAQLGVARISYGAATYQQMAEALKEAGRQAFSGLSELQQQEFHEN
jgi:2-methylisocitrate lyase-like PEP mutase family enzyme